MYDINLIYVFDDAFFRTEGTKLVMKYYGKDHNENTHFDYRFMLYCTGTKRFTSDYFVSKYNLSLPEVSQEMLDISDLTHTKRFIEYYYRGKTEKLDRCN